MKLLIKKIISLFYFILYKTNMLLYASGFLKTYKPNNVFVIGVGNISVGGSGKTPFVRLLSKYLETKKHKPCIVSGGYKKKSPGEIIINGNNISSLVAQNVGDEPFMLAKELPHLSVYVGSKLKNIKQIDRKKIFSHAIIDDGYQSFSIKKDYSVLLIDLSVSLKKYRLLPAGFLREPLSEIKRANLIVFTKTNLCSDSDLKVKKIFFEKHINFKKQSVVDSSIKALLFSAVKEKLTLVQNAGFLQKTKYVSFSGIANPKSFLALQKKLKVKPYKNFNFKDHYKYPLKSINRIVGFSKKNNIKTILTTKKDYYKICNFFQSFNIYVLDIEHVLSENIDI